MTTIACCKNCQNYATMSDDDQRGLCYCGGVYSHAREDGICEQWQHRPEPDEIDWALLDRLAMAW